MVWGWVEALNAAVPAVPLVTPPTPTYYVSNQGKDTGTGAINSPWKTIQKAVSTVTPGSRILVADGIYPEIVTTGVDGTDIAPIQLLANSTNVIVNGFVVDNANWTISGFQITGNSVPGNYGSILVLTGGDNLVVQSNYFNSSPNLVYQLMVLHQLNGNDSYVTNLTVNGNWFVNSQNTALQLRGRGHLISSNYFSNTNGWDMIRPMCSSTIIRGNYATAWL
jgi:hypothetical protein